MKSRGWVGGLGLAGALGACAAAAQPVALPAADAPYTEAALMQGVRASAEDCARRGAGVVWAALDESASAGDGECLAWWATGFDPAGAGPIPRLLVVFDGDLIVRRSDGSVGGVRSYLGDNDAGTARWVKSEMQALGLPTVFLARPGTYGSSGAHRERRRPRESRAISAALDALRQRWNVGEFVVAGQSGGGHVVLSLLALRSDIVCAVAASAPASPRARWEAAGLNADATGFDDSFEPLLAIGRKSSHRDLRVFVLADPADRNVPYPVQRLAVERLNELKIPVALLHGRGAGAARHGLERSARAVAAQCLRGESTARIRQAAQRQGLRG